MHVLGVNGWPERTHDASACLLSHGRVVAFAEEERFLRRKHSFDVAPLHAAAYCLSQAGLSAEDLDAVAFGWDLPDLYQQHGLAWNWRPEQVLQATLPRSFFPRRADPPLHFVPHHIAHAASSYLYSGRDHGAVLVLDGQGESASATYGSFRDRKLTVTGTAPVAWSLGYFYQAVCAYAGLSESDPGKLMGLAAHGSVVDPFFGAIELTGDGYLMRHLPAEISPDPGIPDRKDPVVRAWLAQLAKVLPIGQNMPVTRYDPELGRFRHDTERDPFDYRDVAASAQAGLEIVVCDMVARLLAGTSESALHLAGGVAFNASLNGVLLGLDQVSDLFIQPVAGDAGVSLGAAAYVAEQLGDTVTPMGQSVAWGPGFTAQQIADALAQAGVSYSEPADIAAATAGIVASGGIVGWFQGRAEAGPRALGQRSILADPRDPRTRDQINLRVKRREWWRPLAPSIDADSAAKYLHCDADLPFMVVTSKVRDEQLPSLGAVAHVDATTRPQTVRPGGDQDSYHAYLMELGERTGVPASLNTSFNSFDEPIACTPQDAMRSFARMPLDALAIGPWLVRK